MYVANTEIIQYGLKGYNAMVFCVLNITLRISLWITHSVFYSHLINTIVWAASIVSGRYCQCTKQYTILARVSLLLKLSMTWITEPSSARVCGRVKRIRDHLEVWINLKPMSVYTHQKGIFSALLDLCEGNTWGTGRFPSQRQVTRSFDIFFALCPNKRLNETVQTYVIWDAIARIMTSL